MLTEVEKVETQTKHQQISGTIHKLIKSGKILPGSKLQGEQELARMFGVSHITIRQAKKTLTSQGVLYNVNRKGTFVREDALQARVGVFSQVNVMSEDSARFIRMIIQHLEELCASEIALRYYHPPKNQPVTPETAAQLLEQAMAQQPQAVLLFQEMPELEALCRERGIPRVSFLRQGSQSNAITTNFEQIASLGLRHFFSKGIHEIAWIGRQGNSAVHFAQVLCKEYITNWPAEWWVLNNPYRPEEGMSYEECGYRQFKHIWSQPRRPKGLFVLDDIMLRGAVFAMLEMGVIPSREFELVSFCNRNSTAFIPVSFVKVEVDPLDYAQAASQLLRKVIQDSSAQITIPPINPRLVV